MHTPQRSGPSPRRTAALLTAGLLAAGVLAAPAAATATPPTPATAPATAPATLGSECTVASATLNWGIKERFRSYISGSIANGEWTVSDDMRYETPDFIWDQVSGTITDDLESGSIAFTGAVQFTGHSGALQMDLADPVIEFDGEDTAYLAVTFGATDSADTGTEVAAESVRIAKIDLTDAVTAGGTELQIDGAVPRFTADGADAMNGDYGTYIAGEDLDPIRLSATLSGCELGESVATAAPTPEPTESAQPPAVVDPEAAAPSIPWLPIGIGAVALLVIGITGGMLLGGRKRPQAAAKPADTDHTGPEA